MINDLSMTHRNYDVIINVYNIIIIRSNSKFCHNSNKQYNYDDDNNNNIM